MKISVLAHTDFNTDPRVRRETESLAEKARRIDVFCLRKPGQPAYEKLGNIHLYRGVKFRKPQNNLSMMVELSYFFVSSLFWLSLNYFRKRYEYVHVHTVPDFEIFAAVIPKLFGAVVVLDMHESMPELYMRKFGESENNRMIRLIKWFEKWSIKFADHVIFATPFMQRTVVERSPGIQQCSTLINVPDLKYFDGSNVLFSPKGPFRLVYHGTLSELHGVDVAIRAIKIIVQETDIPVQFHIYGTGPSKTAFQVLTRDLGLEKIVIFHTIVPLEKLGEILSGMDAGIVPKRDGIFADEAISTKLFEFAAAGIPAMVSRTKGDTLYFDDSMVLFFEPGNERELANRIVSLYLNPELRHRLSENAKEVIRKINWGILKTDLFKVFNNPQVG